MPDFIEQELLFAADVTGGPSLEFVDSSSSVFSYFSALAAYHDLQTFNFGLKEFVYSDSKDLNLVLGGEVPTLALIKSDKSSLQISGGDNVLIFSETDSHIQIDGGVTRIFVDAESDSEITLDILSGEVIVDFLHSDLSKSDDLSMTENVAQIDGFPAKVAFNFKVDSTGSVDLSVLGVKQHSLGPLDVIVKTETDPVIEEVYEEQHDQTAPVFDDGDLMITSIEHQADLMLLHQANLYTTHEISFNGDVENALVVLDNLDDLDLYPLMDNGHTVVQAAEITLNQAMEMLAFSSVQDLIWDDAVDVIHDVNGV